MPLCFEERKFIVTKNKAFRSYTRFSRPFCKEFKKKHAPTHKTYKRVIEKFESTGSVQDKPRSGAPKTSTTNEKIEEVRVLLQDNPGMSLTRVHLATGISVGTAYSIATGILNLYPYRIKLLHKLKPTDFPKRIKFAIFFNRTLPSCNFLPHQTKPIFISMATSIITISGFGTKATLITWSKSSSNLLSCSFDVPFH